MSDTLREILDVGVFWEYRAVLLRGLAVNFAVFFGAAALAVGLGFVAALLRVNRLRLLRAIGTVYVETFRNAPDYVMIVWVHFVLPLLIGTLLHTRLELDPFVSGVVALGLVYGGYFAETFRTGIEAVPTGHLEAARSLGLGEARIMWRIILPQVVRRMLPESINVFISLFKATTIVSLIAVPELMYRVSMITQQEMRPLPLYTGAALVYFLIVLCAGSALRAFAERWRAKIL